MRTRVLLACAGATWFLASGPWGPPVETAGPAATMVEMPGSGDVCLMPPDRAAYRQTRGGGAGRVSPDDVRRSAADWLEGEVEGGDIMPARGVFDPYPTFNAVAVMPRQVGRSSPTRASRVCFPRHVGGQSVRRHHRPPTRILGPNTGIGFIAGGEVDPKRREVYAVNNDGGGVVMFGYDQTGAVAPSGGSRRRTSRGAFRSARAR